MQSAETQRDCIALCGETGSRTYTFTESHKTANN